MKLIRFRVSEDTFGMPDPHIADDTFIILLQGEQANVGRYIEPKPPHDPSPSFDHPENVNELAAEALAVVRSYFPHLEASEQDFVFTCPDELAQQAVWVAKP